MPLFLDTRGNSSLAISVCQRCNTKCAYSDLIMDGNIPNFWVCSEECRDNLDPYRLPARAADRLSLEHPRPDTPMYPLGPSAIWANQYYGVTQILPTHPWQALTPYEKGASVTPMDVDLGTTTLPQNQFVCVVAGISAASAPTWPPGPSATVTDGTVTWFNNGIQLIVG